ncbi:MAG: DUF3306 domain-containing protein [Cocleimonas sp.]|nr:DUF3306 domain-containing protein [Cocleimonas sp.]
MVAEKEGFASRWSRRKQEVAKEADVAVEDGDVEVVDRIIREPIIDEETLAEQRLEKLNELTDEDMPDIETLNEDSDFSGFMSTGVSETLRKMALQKLFHGKTYNIRDGLDEYDGDYTSFEKLDPSVITCDMKHILEVEAEKLLAKEKEEEAERLAQLEGDTDLEDGLDESLELEEASDDIKNETESMKEEVASLEGDFDGEGFENDILKDNVEGGEDKVI